MISKGRCKVINYDLTVDAIIMGYDLIGATVMNYDNTDAIVIHIAL